MKIYGNQEQRNQSSQRHNIHTEGHCPEEFRVSRPVFSSHFRPPPSSVSHFPGVNGYSFQTALVHSIVRLNWAEWRPEKNEAAIWILLSIL